MGLKEIVGITVTGFILVYCFWFIIPGMKTAYVAEIKGLNMTTPLMQTIKPIADNWFILLPAIIALVGGYTFYLYMTRLAPEDEQNLMMKLVVATVTGIILCLAFMYFMFPLLITEHTAATSIFNSTDPTIATSYAFGSGFYQVIPFLPILAGLFIIFAYALRRSMYE